MDPMKTGWAADTREENSIINTNPDMLAIPIKTICPLTMIDERLRFKSNLYYIYRYGGETIHGIE